MKPFPASRRRFLTVVAACASLPFAPLRAGEADTERGAGLRAGARIGPEPVVWKGTALGALASMTLVHEDRERARALLAECVVEIERLERIFSLYRSDSALSRLNAQGRLQAPPTELVELLSTSLTLARASAGAFDPTVQPLYRLYESHFRAPGARPAGPDAEAIAQALRRVDHRRVDVSAERIALGARGMAITLNGIAQGYVTDRIADRLRSEGFVGVAIDLGEARVAGRRADGQPWTAAVVDPDAPSRTLFELTLGESAGAFAALATSAGAGTRFGPDPRVHHLFDPRTGHSANRWRSVSVASSRATIADGLSTALSIASPQRAAALLSSYPSVRAWFAGADGRIETMRG